MGGASWSGNILLSPMLWMNGSLHSLNEFKIKHFQNVLYLKCWDVKRLNICPTRPISSCLFFHLNQSDILCTKQRWNHLLKLIKSHENIQISGWCFLAGSCHINEITDYPICYSCGTIKHWWFFLTAPSSASAMLLWSLSQGNELLKKRGKKRK